MLLIPIELQVTILIYLKNQDIVHLSQCCHDMQCYYKDYKIRDLMMIILHKHGPSFKNKYNDYFNYKPYIHKIWSNQYQQVITLVQHYHPWDIYCQPLIQCGSVRYSRYTLLSDTDGTYIIFNGSRYYLTLNEAKFLYMNDKLKIIDANIKY